MGEPSKAIIVTGVARGGTSMVGSLLAHMGVPMGKGGPRYENPYLQWAVLAGRWDVVALLVNEISAVLPLWGWKLPLLSAHLPTVAALLPDPHFVFVTKDVVSIARRRGDQEDPQRFARLVGRTALAYGQMAEFGRRSNSPTLFLSYEEALKDINAAVALLARYTGVTVAKGSDISQRIAADRLKYKTGHRDPRIRSDLDNRLSRICEKNDVARRDLSV